VLNVSQGGMQIRLEDHVESYDALKFEIALAAKRLHLYGKVVWRGAECDAGIRFLGLTNEQKRLLADWVQGQPEL
jgi:PilZ domain